MSSGYNDGSNFQNQPSGSTQVKAATTYIGRLESFNFSLRDDAGEGYKAAIELALNTTAEAGSPSSITLEFAGVRDCEIGTLENPLFLMVSIRDVSDKQLESLRFHVSEEENAAFSFFCESYRLIPHPCA